MILHKIRRHRPYWLQIIFKLDKVKKKKRKRNQSQFQGGRRAVEGTADMQGVKGGGTSKFTTCYISTCLGGSGMSGRQRALSFSGALLPLYCNSRRLLNFLLLPPPPFYTIGGKKKKLAESERKRRSISHHDRLGNSFERIFFI